MAEKNESDLTTSEKQCVVGLGFCGPGAGANTSVADVKDGKLVRLRPLHLDWKYDPKQFNSWKMEARGKSFEPRLKSFIPPFSLAYKKRIPTNFIAGTLCDPKRNEIVEGAALTLRGPNGENLTAQTNGWGDFWFEGLAGGAYSLDIQASGYQNKTLGSIDARESVNLGDLPLG